MLGPRSVWMRRFPAPWTVESIPGGFKIMDSSGQSLAYVYGHADKRDAETEGSHLMTRAAQKKPARRIQLLLVMRLFNSRSL